MGLATMVMGLFGSSNSRTKEISAVMDRETQAFSKYMDEARMLRIQTRSNGVYLIMEDDPGIARLLQVIIKSCGRKSVCVSSLHEALEYLENHGAEGLACCVADIRLPDGDGETLINLIEARYPAVPVVVYTGSTDRVSALQRAHPKVKIMCKGVHDGVKSLMRALALPNCEMESEVLPG